MSTIYKLDWGVGETSWSDGIVASSRELALTQFGYFWYMLRLSGANNYWLALSDMNGRIVFHTEGEQ